MDNDSKIISINVKIYRLKVVKVDIIKILLFI